MASLVISFTEEMKKNELEDAMNNMTAKAKLYSLLVLDANHMFRKLVEDNRAGVYIADDQGNLMYVNSAFVRILGYSRKEDLLGKNLAKELYVDPKQRELFLKDMQKMGSVLDYEVKNKRLDGSTADLAISSNWIRDESNQIIGVEGIIHDITEKKKIEEEFKNEKDRLNQILDFEESLSLVHHVDQIGKFTVEQTAGILNAQKSSLMLFDQQKEELYIVAAKGLDESMVQHTHIKMGESIAGNVAKSREPTLVLNIEYDKQFQRHNRPYYPTRSFMSAPILFGPELLGVINVADKKSASWEVFTQADLKMLCVIARGVGIALENARLYQTLEDKNSSEPWASLRHRL